MGKASTKAQNKWIEKAYDRINLTVYKGQKERIKAVADARNMSVNGYIQMAIAAQMERDGHPFFLEGEEEAFAEKG